MAILTVDSLSKVFDTQADPVNALRSITLSVKQGEFVSITGPSGSGKSTLLYILGLLDKQTSGTYSFDGMVTDALNDNQRSQLRNESFGFVFQSFHLLPRATALRNVALPLFYQASFRQKLPRNVIMSRAAEALNAVSLSDRATHKPNELSGGQRQRVAIARALVNRPRVIFADEPTGNLDSKHGSEILSIFQALNRQGATIVLVTHDPNVARLSNREVRMRDGEIIDEVQHAVD